MAELWSEKFSKKLRHLQETEDEEGIRRLRFGRYVCWARKTIKKISQKAAADRAGLSRAEWIRIENGTHFPHASNIPAIADALDVSVRGLFKRAGFAIPKKYAKYSEEQAKKDFVYALRECDTHAEFLMQMQLIWQLYQQEQMNIPQRVYIDPAYAQILEYIFSNFSVEQRLTLAIGLLEDLSHKYVYNSSNPQHFFDNLNRAISWLRIVHREPDEEDKETTLE